MDYLSQQPAFRRERGGEQGPILKPANLSTSAVALPDISKGGEDLRFVVSGARICSIPPVQWAEDFIQEVKEVATRDTQYQEGLQAITVTVCGTEQGDDDGERGTETGTADSGQGGLATRRFGTWTNVKMWAARGRSTD